jgi:hypothetical protein
VEVRLLRGLCVRATRLLGQALVIVGICGLIAGCTSTTGSTGGSPEGQAAEPAASQQADSGGSGGWMDGIPASVPKFEYGTFDNEQSSKMEAGPQTIYSLYYEGVSKADAEAYIEKLKAAGFSITPDNLNQGLSAAGELKKGDEKLIGLSIAQQDSGHVDYTINVLAGAK